jgi:TRAP-type C4-dicarboxylate transport system permease small subunit
MHHRTPANLLRRINSHLVWLLERALALLMGTLVVDVLWQVVSRYFLRRPSSWTDELATLLIIWVALLGASVAFARRSHLGLDTLVTRLPPGPRLMLQGCVHALVALFALTVLLLGGLKLVALTLLTGQVSPALGIQMGQVYLALPVSGLCVLVSSLTAAVECFAALRRTERTEDA